MKKIISYILVVTLLLCSAVVFADEKEVVIDTEVPVFNNLVDGSNYSGNKKVEIADLSAVDCVLMKAGSGTVTFAGKTFSGYTKIAEKQNLNCINYTEIATVSDVGTYMVYATDIYNHDIAVRFNITKAGEPVVGGGGGGGGGGSSVVKPPYANGDSANITGTVTAGEKITLDSDTGNVKIYYTTDGTTPTSKSTLYDDDKGIILTEGQILKAVAIKNGTSSEVSEWKCVAAPEDSPRVGESIVGDVLEDDEHIVYMTGYPDNTFGPNKNMTRAEVATMFARLMKEKINPDATYEASFTDVTADDWFCNYVGYIEKFGIITGYDDGTFKPQNTITRAEFVTMASRFATITKEYGCDFTDITNEHWAYEYIAFAAGNRWISGYKDKTFRADHTITRAEVVTIVNNMLVRNADEDYVKANKAILTLFDDVSEEHWAYYDIIEATNEHTYNVTDNAEKWN